MLDKFHNFTNYMINVTQNNKLLNKVQLLMSQRWY